jgi:Virulence factor membrane-bound polymerase, C-terminal/O-Antigen ligase/Protein glycosylation ligase
VMSSLYVFALAACIAIGAAGGNERRRRLMDTVFAVLLAAGLVSVVLAVLQWFGMGDLGHMAPTRPGDRPFANLAQPNHLASLLALALVAGLWFYETGRISGAMLCAAALCLTAGMVLTRTRMVWVVAAVFVMAWALLRQYRTTRLTSVAALGWLLFFAACTLALGPLSQVADVSAPLPMAERLQGGGGRLRIWAAVADGLLQSPWFGHGWGQVSHAGLHGSTRHYTGESMLMNSHNTPLDLLVWNGIPLGLAIVLGVIWWWVHQIRRCDSVERAVVLVALGVVSIHALLEFPLDYLYFVVPTGLLVGSLSPPPSTATRPLARAAAAGVLGISALIASYLFAEYSRVEDASRDNRMLAAGYAPSAALPQVRVIDAPVAFMTLWRTEARPSMTPEELDWMRKVTYRYPASPTLLRYAAALGLNGQAQEAARTLVQLCNMHRATRCDEGRVSWRLLQTRFAPLASIAYPPTPNAP